MLNLALIGTGRIADGQLAPAIAQADGVQLWSVLSRSADRAARFAESHRAKSSVAGHTSLDALLNDPDLDGVVIATPDKLHADQCVTAAMAGKHVLVEKPMVTSLRDADRMIEACDDRGVRLGVAYHLRWHAGHRLVADVVRAGDLGEIRHMRVQWSWLAPDAGNWRARREVGRWWSLAGVGTHCLDLIRWLMVPTCGEVELVRGVISKAVWRGPHDETAAVALRFESGATAEFCSSVNFESPHRMEIYGSEGYAICTNTLGASGAGTIQTRAGQLEFPIANPYVGEVLDFVRAIRDDATPAVDGREGRRNVELLLQVIGADDQ
ncbi:MAG: Gfo/Idh/MocA family protein [Gemmatimonadales bacterium]